MQCLQCGAEMRVIAGAPRTNLQEEDGNPQTFQCAACQHVNQPRTWQNSVGPSCDPITMATDGAVAAPPESVEVAPLDHTSGVLTSGDDDEDQELLRRALAMVRSQGRSSQRLKGLTDGLKTPADLDRGPAPPKGSRVVEIREDLSCDTAYTANDTRTGLVILRHPDRVRLRLMCQRLGWQVVERGMAVAED